MGIVSVDGLIYPVDFDAPRRQAWRDGEDPTEWRKAKEEWEWEAYKERSWPGT